MTTGVALRASLRARVVAIAEGGFTDKEGKKVGWTDVFVERDGEIAVLRQGHNDRPGTFEALGYLRSLKVGQDVDFQVEGTGKTKHVEMPVYRVVPPTEVPGPKS